MALQRKSISSYPGGKNIFNPFWMLLNRHAR